VGIFFVFFGSNGYGEHGNAEPVMLVGAGRDRRTCFVTGLQPRPKARTIMKYWFWKLIRIGKRAGLQEDF